MRFRDDIDPATTWLVSDTHFGHDNIVGFCHRPEDHEQAMIAEWRKVVGPEDTLLHLGDLNYGSNARFKNLTAKELTGGRKLLIQGNHDRQRYSFYKQSGFQIVSPFKVRFGGGGPLNFTSGEHALEDHRRRVWFDGGWWDPAPWEVSFSHYPWNPKEDGGAQPENHLRVHGHIHNNGYTRDAFVPFLKGHVNLSVEQTHYSPVNLKLLLDAVLLGQYPETTDDQLAEAREIKAANLAAKEAAR